MMTTCNNCGAEIAVADARVYTKDGFDIVRCPSCGLVFRAHMPAQEELAAIYSDVYFGATVK